MFDKFWWWLNRKPSRRAVPYVGIVFNSFLFGALTMVGLLLLVIQVWWLGIAVVVSVLGWLIAGYFSDKKNGYVDAYYEAYLAHRERIGKKLGKM